MTVDLIFKIAPENGQAERGVTLQLNGARYFEGVKLSSGFQRSEFIKRAARHFNLKPSDLDGLDDMLVGEALKAAGEGSVVEYPSETLAELSQRTFEREYYVKGILAARQPMIYGGPLKAMKTTTALDLALSLATAGNFLGYFRTERAVRTAFMSGESSPDVVQETLLRIARAAGVDPAGVSNLLLSDKLPKFGRVDHQEAMGRYITDNELEIVFIDCAYLAVPGGEASNVMLMGDLLRSMGDVFTDCGATMILLHHLRTTRVAPHDPGQLDDVSWAGYREFAAQWLLLTRRRPYEAGTGHHELWLTTGGRMGHSGLWGVNIGEGRYHPDIDREWNVEVLSAAQARDQEADAKLDAKEAERAERAEKQLERDREKLCRALAKYPQGETSKVIRETAGMSGARFTASLAAMLQTGEVVSCQVIKPNRKTPYEGYRLAE